MQERNRDPDDDIDDDFDISLYLRGMLPDRSNDEILTQRSPKKPPQQNSIPSFLPKTILTLIRESSSQDLMQNYQTPELEQQGPYLMVFASQIAKRQKQLAEWPPITPKQFVETQNFPSMEMKIVIVIEHLTSTTLESSFREGLVGLIINLEKGQVDVAEAFEKLTTKQLWLVNSHCLFVVSFESKVTLLLSKVKRFFHLKKINFWALFIMCYEKMLDKVDFVIFGIKLRGLVISTYWSTFGKEILNQFLNALLKHIEGQHHFQMAESQRLWRRNQRIQKQTFNLAEGEEDGPTILSDRSKGAFDNAYEQSQFMKTVGIYEYRLQRTIQLLKKKEVLVPSTNSQRARNYAIFLIRLTDLHLQKITKKTIANCKLSQENKVNRDYRGVWDEVSYFQTRNFGGKLPGQRYNRVYRCRYRASKLCLYNELRCIQMKKQKNLFLDKNDKIAKKLQYSGVKDSKAEKIVGEYYKRGECTDNIRNEFKFYRKPEQIGEKKAKVQMEHYRTALGEHPHYRDSWLLMRLTLVF